MRTKLLILMTTILVNSTTKAIDFNVNNFKFTTETDSTVVLNGYIDQPQGSLLIPNNVTFGDKSYIVKKIGDNAFLNCNMLRDVTIPSSVIHIGNNAFKYCGRLNSINIPTGIQSIGISAFNNCNVLSGELILPETIKSIGIYAFAYCQALSSVKIPNSIKKIESGTFQSCNGLTGELNIPLSVDTIEESAFNNCYKITSIILPPSIKKIGKNAFSYCKISSIIIPSSVTSLDLSAISGCSNLNDIIVDNNNLIFSSQDGLLFNKIKNTLVYCPEGKADSISIPTTVITIQSSAFANCAKLTTIVIPSTVTSVGTYAFYGCYKLTKIICQRTSPPNVGTNPYFSFLPVSSCILRVPAGTKNAYKTAYGWKDFTNIEEFDLFNSLKSPTHELLNIRICDNTIRIDNESGIKQIRVFDISGNLISTDKILPQNIHSILLVNVSYIDGLEKTIKLLKR